MQVHVQWGGDSVAPHRRSSDNRTQSFHPDTALRLGIAFEELPVRPPVIHLRQRGGCRARKHPRRRPYPYAPEILQRSSDRQERFEIWCGRKVS